MFELFLSDRAKKQYDRLSTNTRKQCNIAIDRLKMNPFYGPQIKKLKGELKGLYRYRVGDFRIVYSVQPGRIMIRVIEHRGKVY